MLSDLKIALVYGGSSSEREISIKSGEAVRRSLERLNLNFKVLDPLDPKIFVKELVEYNPDVIFNLLHGKFGEDGSIQGLFEILRYKYTGSPVKASAIAMDKSLTKEIAVLSGIKTPKWITVNRPEDAKNWDIFPAVVKPNQEGSSIGVCIVHTKDKLSESIKKALELDKRVIIEQFISGREITVSIIDGKVLEPIEIVVEEGFYDFKNKYLSDKTRYIVSPDLSIEEKKKLIQDSLKIYKKLGCRGAARIDFILKDGIPYLLEINTIPGMTDHSLLPKAAEASGLDFDTLVITIIKGALNE